jgi:hypothetical protein
VALVGLGEATGENRAESAIRNALTSPLLEVEWSGSTGALIHITGGPDMSLAEANSVGEIVSEKMSANANVIWGARVDPRLSGVLRVMLILTGVKSPQLLPRSKEESGIATATRRLAEFGVISAHETIPSPRGIRAKAHNVGKVPSLSRRPSWEERLKPLEKRLAGRARKDKRELPRKNAEELGLRKIFEGRREPVGDV